MTPDHPPHVSDMDDIPALVAVALAVAWFEAGFWLGVVVTLLLS